MFKQTEKETHVFLEDGRSFTSIAKKKFKGVYQVYTTIKLTGQMADQINDLYGAHLKVVRINFRDGFLLMKLKEKSTYRHIVKAIKTVLYGQS
ncbi:hypothetical protein SDC9_136059 [bioreactor metagenome]|uniref:Uncharacterized protein n=1 Tax=bioreactor metagenome TaxID=1076179 RepID=A0A645DIA3_9ZZZZ|nr:hypothetical protein [Proteiniphilum sp.]MEA4918119.1 hypothetical protein [Proteiniphilum sp.]